MQALQTEQRSTVASSQKTMFSRVLSHQGERERFIRRMKAACFAVFRAHRNAIKLILTCYPAQ